MSPGCTGAEGSSGKSRALSTPRRPMATRAARAKVKRVIPRMRTPRVPRSSLPEPYSPIDLVSTLNTAARARMTGGALYEGKGVRRSCARNEPMERWKYGTAQQQCRGSPTSRGISDPAPSRCPPKQVRGAHIREPHMTGSLTDSILGTVTPDMKRALASRLGESVEGVQTGLGAATAATLSGLARKAADSEFFGKILRLFEGGAGLAIVASLPSIAASPPTGTAAETLNSFVRMLFGSQQAEVAGAISQHAGLSATSGPALLKMSAAVVLAYFVRAQNAGALTVESLSSTLRAEAATLHSYLPASLLPGAPAAVSSIPRRGVFPPPAVAAPIARWLVGLAVAGALLLGWVLIRVLSGPVPLRPTASRINTAASITSKTAPEPWAALGDMMRVKLPNGGELNVPSLGVEAKLVRFLSDSSAPVTKNSWFDFDRLLFDTGQATLRSVSQEQLTNIAAILKAYPQVKVRIGAYTDNTGDPAQNLHLSQRRADNVREELTRLGVNASRMSAKGYGEENPMSDNSTEEGRQRNRRISLWVTEKPGSAT